MKTKLEMAINSDLKALREYLLRVYKIRALLKKALPTLMFRLPPEPEIAAGLTILLDKYLYYSAMIAEIEAGLKKSNIDIKTFLGVDPATLSGMGSLPWGAIGRGLARLIAFGTHIWAMILSFVWTPEKHHEQTMKLQREQFERELEEQRALEEKRHQQSLELMKKQMEMQAEIQRNSEVRAILVNYLLDTVKKRQDLAETRKQVEETIKALGEVESSDLKKIIQGLYPAIDSAFKEAEKFAEGLKKGRAPDQGRASDRGASESKDVPWNTIALVAVLVGIPLVIHFLKRK
jgi:hypothetical protein